MAISLREIQKSRGDTALNAGVRGTLSADDARLLNQVETIDKKEYQKAKSNPIGQFTGRVMSNVTVGAEQNIAKYGLVVLGDLIMGGKEKAKEQAQIRRFKADPELAEIGEITAISGDLANTLGRKVRNLGMVWYNAAQERYERNFKFVQEGETEHPVATMLADAGTSLLASVGLFAISGPGAAGIAFGILSGGESYLTSQQQGQYRGLSAALGIVDGTVEGALEYIGLDAFMRFGGGRLAVTAKRAITEALQEGLQTGKQGVLQTVFGAREYTEDTLVEILTESLVAAGIGGITGGAVGANVAISTHRNVRNMLMKEFGFDKKESTAVADEWISRVMDEATNISFEMGGFEASDYQYADREVNKMHRQLEKKQSRQKETPQDTPIPEGTVTEAPDIAREGRLMELQQRLKANQKQETIQRRLIEERKKNEKPTKQEEQRLEKILKEQADIEVEQDIIRLRKTGNITGTIDIKSKKYERIRLKYAQKQAQRFREGFLKGRKIAKSDIKSFQAYLTEMIDKATYLTDKQKVRYLKTVKSIQTETQFNKRLAFLETKLQEMQTENIKQTYIQAVDRLLKKVKKTDKLDAETKAIIDKAVKLRRDDFASVTDFNLAETPDVETLILHNIAALNGLFVSAAQAKAAYENLADLFSLGRQHFENMRKARKQFYDNLIGQVLSELSGRPADEIDLEIQTGHEIKIKNSPIKVLSNMMLMWRNYPGLLTDLASDIETEPGESSVELIGDVWAATRTQEYVKQVSVAKLLDAYKTAFGLQTDAQVWQRIQEEENDTVTIPLKERTAVIDRMQARAKWMEWQQEEGRSKLENGNGFTEETIEVIEDFLTPGDIAFIQAQRELYDDLYGKVNPIFTSFKGLNLPYRDHYSHFTADISQIQEGVESASVIDYMLGEAGRGPAVDSKSALKKLSGAKYGLAYKRDVFTMQKYISDMSHFIGFAKTVTMLEKVFKNPRVRKLIETQKGPEFYQQLREYIDIFASGRIDSNASAGWNWLKRMRLNFVKGVLAVKPTIGVKQLLSTVLYNEEMPTGKFIEGILDLPRAIKAGDLDPLINNSYMQSRGYRLERDLIQLQTEIEQARSVLATNPTWERVSFFMMRLGDRAGILAGGWSYYKYLTQDQNMDPAAALDKVLRLANSTQQSPDIAQMPAALRDKNPLVRILGTFKLTPSQYYNRYMDALASAGKISKKDLAKKIFIYHLLLPNLYQWVVNAFRWEPQDQLRASILGPFGEVLILGDLLYNIVGWSVAQMYGDDWKTRPSDDISAAYIKDVVDVLDFIKDFADNGVGFGDVVDGIKELSTVVAPVVGPYAGATRFAADIGRGLETMTKPRPDYSEAVRQMIGYSDYAIEGRPQKKKSKKLF